MFVTKVYEYFNKLTTLNNKLTALDCKFDLVWINFSSCHILKVKHLCLSLLLNIILILSMPKKDNLTNFLF